MSAALFSGGGSRTNTTTSKALVEFRAGNDAFTWVFEMSSKHSLLFSF